MKTKDKIILLISFIGAVLAITFSVFLAKNNYFNEKETKYIYMYNGNTYSDWDILTLSILYVESKGNDSAVNIHNENAVGCLQITPIYVKECNRLGGHFSLSDRFSRQKSIEMFNLIQSVYNPQKDINKAIFLHHPNGNDKYAHLIILKYTELKKLLKNNK